MFTIPHPLLDT